MSKKYILVILLVIIVTCGAVAFLLTSAIAGTERENTGANSRYSSVSREDGSSYGGNAPDNGIAPPKSAPPESNIPQEMPVFPEDIALRALALLDNSVEVSSDAMARYISADGDEEVIRLTLMEIQRISEDICRGLTDEREKLRAISEWTARNIYYDYDARNTSVTEETVCLAHILETRRTVCMGFANLCAALAEAQGIDCRVVHGAAVPIGSFSEGDSGELHEYNVAIIDGEPLWFDSLWDTSNGYIMGEYREGRFREKYFDMELLTLSKNHRADRIEIREYFGVMD